MKYVIGTGWWCEHVRGSSPKNEGHPYTRSPAFHEVWTELVFKYADPCRLIVVDSNSPIEAAADDREQFIALDRNYQKTPETVIHRGWMRSFLCGASFAWNCDADFIYVEQDCLVSGAGWVQRIYEQAGRAGDGQFLVGNPRYGEGRVPWKLQQSLIFVPHGLIPQVVFGISQVRDSAVPEQQMADGGVPFDFLPFGYGRIRPIDWTDEILYAQHMTANELVRLGQREGIADRIRRDLSVYRNGD